MGDTLPHITVCVCTFKRLALLRKLLEELTAQKTEGLFSYSVVVADNDASESARALVESFAATGRLQLCYCVEREQNIALVRNLALAQARGEFAAFIDDDEYPQPDWLLQLYKTCVGRNVAGVLGPVRPYFDQAPPRWVEQGRFFERREHETGFRMHWEECRTGNVLFRRSILDGAGEPFRREFGTGGEDKDFFMRMSQARHEFIWCNEAVALELVPPHRWRRRFMLGRALLRGRNVLKHPVGRARNIATSLVAVPAYACVLPFMWLAGPDRFMHYAIRFCDHAGRLLALARLNPVSEREM